MKLIRPGSRKGEMDPDSDSVPGSRKGEMGPDSDSVPGSRKGEMEPDSDSDSLQQDPERVKWSTVSETISCFEGWTSLIKKTWVWISTQIEKMSLHAIIYVFFVKRNRGKGCDMKSSV